MDRITTIARIINRLDGVASILDAGCRDAALAGRIPQDIRYSGADLFPGERVKYVGDITAMTIDEKFSLVVAADILEHLEKPSTTFDKLAGLTERYMIVSLPNCYDMKSMFKFVRKQHLGGKYAFSVDEPLDRHRWLMNFNEINHFYEAKAAQHRMKLEVVTPRYGDSGAKGARAGLGRLLRGVMPARLWVPTVFGVFEKH